MSMRSDTADPLSAERAAVEAHTRCVAERIGAGFVRAVHRVLEMTAEVNGVDHEVAVVNGRLRAAGRMDLVTPASDRVTVEPGLQVAEALWRAVRAETPGSKSQGPSGACPPRG